MTTFSGHKMDYFIPTVGLAHGFGGREKGQF